MALLRLCAVVAALALLLTGASAAPAPETFTLRGTVLLPDGTPAGGARVILDYSDSPEWVMPEVRTDGEGKFSFAIPLPVRHWVSCLWAFQAGCAATGTARTSGNDLVLRLGAHPVAFTGVITGPDGKPVAGAEVALLALLGRDEHGGSFDLWPGGGAGWRATSGADGRFSFPGLPPGTVVNYAVYAAGLAATSNQWRLDQGDAAIKLWPGASVSGRVLANGEPVPGVVVSAEWPPGVAAGQAVTGADGTYTLGGLGFGGTVLRVASPPAGLCSSLRVVDPHRGGFTVTDQDLVLSPGALLRGKIALAPTSAHPPPLSVAVDWAPEGTELRDAQPLPGNGFYTPRLQGAATQFFADAGPDGTYQLHVPPGKVALRVTIRSTGSVAGWSCDPLERRIAPTEGSTNADLDFLVTAPAQLGGRVLRADGRPAVGVEVVIPSTGYLDPQDAVHTDAQGLFSTDLPPGRDAARSAAVMARDVAAGQVGLAFVAGPQEPAEIRLGAGSYFTTTATDAEGRPQPGASAIVHLVSGDGRGVLMLPGGVADGQGRLRLGPLPAGVGLTVMVEWTQQAYLLDHLWDKLGPFTLEVGAEKELPPLHVDLLGRQVSGTVLDVDGGPAAGAVVSCSAGPRGVVRADDHGAFTLTNLPRGAALQLAARHATQPRFALVPLAPDEHGGIEVRLQALGGLTGTVVDADGKPVAGARVLVLAPPPLNAAGNNSRIWASLAGGGWKSPPLTDANGKWQATDLYPGDGYQVIVDLRAQELTGNAPATVKSGGTTDLGRLRLKHVPGPPTIIVPLPAPPAPGAAGPAPKGSV